MVILLPRVQQAMRSRPVSSASLYSFVPIGYRFPYGILHFRATIFGGTHSAPACADFISRIWFLSTRTLLRRDPALRHCDGAQRLWLCMRGRLPWMRVFPSPLSTSSGRGRTSRQACAFPFACVRDCQGRTLWRSSQLGLLCFELRSPELPCIDA